MSVKLGEAHGEIRLDATGVRKGTKQAADSLITLKDTAATVGGALKMALVGAVVAGGAALGALGAAAWQAGNELDEAYDKIIVGTGATGKALEGLKEDFEAVFAATPTGAGTAASVISELNTRLGLTDKALQDVSRSVLESSRLLGEDATTNAQLFSRVMGDWDVAAEQSTATLDKMFVASQATGIGMGELMTNVVQFGAPMRQMGFDLADAIALFGKWEKEGVNAELVMGSLRIAAGNFARSNTPLREGLLETVKTIQGTTDESKALALAMEVFGARAGADMSAAIREGRFDIEDLLVAMQDSEGSILDTAEATMDWGEKLQMLKNKATLGLGPLGGLLMDAAGALLDRLLPGVEAVTEKLAGMGEAVRPLFDTLLAGDLEGAAEIIKNTLGGLVPDEVRESLDGLFEAVGNLKSAFEESLPMLQEFGEDMWRFLTDAAATAGPQIIESATAIINTLAELWREHGETIMAVINFAWRLIVTTIGGTIVLVMGIIQGWLSWMQGIFTAISQMIEGDWQGALATLAEAALKAFGEVLKAFEAFFNMALSVVGTNLASFRAVWNNNLNMLATIVRVAMQNALKAVTDQINAFKEAGQKLVEGIKEGIRSRFRQMLRWVEGLVALLPAAVKKALGISSPASTTMPSGIGAVEGIEAGWRKAFPDLLRTIASMSQEMATIPALAMAGQEVTAPAVTRMQQVEQFNFYAPLNFGSQPDSSGGLADQLKSWRVR